MKKPSRTKRKQQLFHVGACMSLAAYATEFIERNKYSTLGLAFWRHTQHLKHKLGRLEPQTPGERHAYERGLKRGQCEREQIARRPIELFNMRRGILSDGTDADVVFAEINPDQYEIFYVGCDRAGLSRVHVYIKTHVPVENGDMAAIVYRGRNLLCTVKYISDRIELYDSRTDKLFAAVQSDDCFSVIGKFESCGRDFVYPNAKETPLSDAMRKRGYVTAADIVRGKAAEDVGE